MLVVGIKCTLIAAKISAVGHACVWSVTRTARLTGMHHLLSVPRVFKLIYNEPLCFSFLSVSESNYSREKQQRRRYFRTVVCVLLFFFLTTLICGRLRMQKYINVPCMAVTIIGITKEWRNLQETKSCLLCFIHFDANL